MLAGNFAGDIMRSSWSNRNGCYRSPSRTKPEQRGYASATKGRTPAERSCCPSYATSSRRCRASHRVRITRDAWWLLSHFRSAAAILHEALGDCEREVESGFGETTETQEDALDAW